MHVLLHLEFNGRRYTGWQHQENGLAVSDAVMNAVIATFGAVTDFHGCSRTDSGVHAYDFCVSLAVERETDDETFCRALNAHLPPDIRAVSCEHVPSDFHARYSVREKEYVYKIIVGTSGVVFSEGLAFPVRKMPDIERMNREAAFLVGKHDFTSFMASGSKITDCTRTVTHAYFEREGNMLVFHIAADGFLYNMVRIIVGTLLDVQSGKISDIKTVLEARDRAKAGKTAPACGLYLNKVTY